MIVVQNLAKKVMTLKSMAAMPILWAIGSQGSDTGPLWSSCLLLAVPRRLFCFGSLLILDVVRCYLWLFALYLNIKIGKKIVVKC